MKISEVSFLVMGRVWAVIPPMTSSPTNAAIAQKSPRPSRRSTYASLSSPRSSSNTSAISAKRAFACVRSPGPSLTEFIATSPRSCSRTEPTKHSPDDREERASDHQGHTDGNLPGDRLAQDHRRENKRQGE